MAIEKIIIPPLSRTIPTAEPYSSIQVRSLGYEVSGDHDPADIAALIQRQHADLDAQEDQVREKYGGIQDRKDGIHVASAIVGTRGQGSSKPERPDYEKEHGVPGIPVGAALRPKERVCAHPDHRHRGGGLMKVWAWNYCIARFGVPVCKVHEAEAESLKANWKAPAAAPANEAMPLTDDDRAALSAAWTQAEALGVPVNDMPHLKTLANKAQHAEAMAWLKDQIAVKQAVTQPVE